MKRKLAAVMFTDIVGFTQHMSVDEKKALSLLDEKIAITQSVIKKFQGSYIKNIGDGTLSYFSSATEAIDCASEIQNTLKNRVELRIGLHLGEIIEKDGDILGDSVNIANRIEKLSSTGGICISSTIYNQLKNKKKYNLKHLGLHSFKGVGRLLDVYGINIDNISEDSQTEVERHKEQKMPSISIIPLRNKGKEEDDFYAYSLSLDILSKVSLTSNIIISSMEDVEALMPNYKSREISKKLKSRYCLTGSLWKKDDVFNLSLELFDHHDNKIIWADSWLEDWKNLANIESTISGNLITILDKSSSDVNHADNSNIADSEAYRIYLKGKYIYYNRQSNKDILKSENLFNESIDIDKSLIQPRMLIGEIAYQKGEYDRALKVFKKNLDMSINNNDSKNISSSLAAIGAIYYQRAEHDKALEYNLQSLKIREKINNIKGVAKSYNSIGAIHDVMQDYDKALSFYKDAIKIWKKINADLDMAPAVFNIANLYNTKGDLDNALKSVKESIDLCKKTKNQTLLGYSYNLLGAILSNKCKYDESLKYLKKALKIKKELSEPEGISSALKSIGHIYYRKGRYKEAMVYYNKSLKGRKTIGYKLGVAKSLRYIGDTFRKMGQYQEAIESYKEALSIMQAIEDHHNSSKILNRLGGVYRKMGRYKKALEILLKSKSIKEDIQDFENLGYTLVEISSAYRWQGNYELAYKYNLESIEIAKKYDMKKLLANNYYHQSLMLINRNNYDEAKVIIEKAISIAKKMNLMSNMAKYLDCLGIILRYEGKFEEAIKIINEALVISKMIGDEHGRRKYLNSIGLIKEQNGDFQGALDLYIECLSISKKISEKRSVAVSHNNMADMHLVLGDSGEALKNHKKAFSYAKRINYKEGEAGFSFNIATNFLKQKKYSQSLKYVAISIEAFKQIQNSFLVECYILETYLHVMKNDRKNALKCYENIKEVDSNNTYGHIRNWELYKISLYMDQADKKFLDNAYKRMQKDLEAIESKSSKELFLKNFTYGKLIIKEFNKDIK